MNHNPSTHAAFIPDKPLGLKKATALHEESFQVLLWLKIQQNFVEGATIPLYMDD